jgi:chromosome segregation ATPase
VVYGRLGSELKLARESLRVVEKELAGTRAANEKLRRELDRAVDRANDAEERIRQLTTPIARDYE